MLRLPRRYIGWRSLGPWHRSDPELRTRTERNTDSLPGQAHSFRNTKDRTQRRPCGSESQSTEPYRSPTFRSGSYSFFDKSDTQITACPLGRIGRVRISFGLFKLGSTTRFCFGCEFSRVLDRPLNPMCCHSFSLPLTTTGAYPVEVSACGVLRLHGVVCQTKTSQMNWRT